MYAMYFDHVHPHSSTQLLQALSPYPPPLSNVIFLEKKNPTHSICASHTIIGGTPPTEVRSSYWEPHPPRKLTLSFLAVISCQKLLS